MTIDIPVHGARQAGEPPEGGTRPGPPRHPGAPGLRVTDAHAPGETILRAGRD